MTEQITDVIGNVLNIGDCVAHIAGGDGYSKLRIEKGVILSFKNQRVQIEKQGNKSYVVPHRLIKTVE